MEKIKLIFVGFGNVGKAFARKLLHQLEARPIYRNILGNDIAIEVSAVVTTKGAYIFRGDWRSELSTLVEKYPSSVELLKRFDRTIDLDQLLRHINPNLAIVTLPPSYSNGQPNLEIYSRLIENQTSIITADKTGLAFKFWDLIERAHSREAYIGYRATVMAGTPATDLMQGVAGKEVLELKSILNATTNYIVSLIESGKTFHQALEQAQREGLTEPDPRIDYEGYDSAAKLAILLNILGYRVAIHNISRTSLNTIDDTKIREAPKKGKSIRYLATATFDKGEIKTAEVKPAELDLGSPLAKVKGNYNGIVIETSQGTISMIGPAGPAENTAEAMLTDLLEYMLWIRRK